MPRFVLALMTAALVAPGLAYGQATGDKPAQRFDEVERGFFVGATAGPFFIVNAPAPAGASRPFSPGQSGMLELGFDLGEFASISVFLQGTANRAGSEYKGFSENGEYSGDFSALIPGAAAKVNLIGFPDAQGTRRTFLYLRAGGGYSMFAPRQLLPTPDILVFAGPGVEYYTRLRHFSIGVELTGTFLVSSQAFGFAVTPTLRYAF